MLPAAFDFFLFESKLRAKIIDSVMVPLEFYELSRLKLKQIARFFDTPRSFFSLSLYAAGSKIAHVLGDETRFLGTRETKRNSSRCFVKHIRASYRARERKSYTALVFGSQWLSGIDSIILAKA